LGIAHACSSSPCLSLQPPGFWDFPSLSTIFPKKNPSLHYSPGETSLIPISLVPARLTQQLLSLQQAGLALLARTAEVDLHRSETATVAIEGTMQ